VPEPGATDLLHLLRRHPHFLAKQGSGIDHFRVRETLHGARAFEIVRLDNSRVEFSYRDCLDPQHSPQRKLCSALRVEVEADILLKKDEYFTKHGDEVGRVACAETGALITKSEAHADHAPPDTFAVLASHFIAARARAFKHSSTLLKAWPDDPYRDRLADRELAEDWRRFHHHFAAIRIISIQANLTQNQGGKRNPKNRQLDLADLLPSEN
jgi:Protein of unknown function (DUF3223)